MSNNQETVVIMGAGPAGLTAAWELAKKRRVVVWEADPVYVGGIARTVEMEGYRFDIGGHRFFSKSKEVNDVWDQILQDEFQDCPRLSRIYYSKKFFNYPLEAMDAFFKLGPLATTRVVLSYAKARLFPISPEPSFQDWVTNRFGKRLFQMFFETYTEKVWGISCKEISADWAAQRIKGLSLREAIASAFKAKKGPATAKTLIREFRYPRLGPGQMWEAATQQIHKNGSYVLMAHRVEEVHWSGVHVTSIAGTQTNSGEPIVQEGAQFISSIPLQELVLAFRPEPPAEVLEAARNLRYRDYLTVCLVVDRADVFPDTWIYIHDPSVKVGRVQNYKNWSSFMVPDAAKTSLGLEYFCFKGDAMWEMSEEELTKLAKDEIEQIGLAKASEIDKAFIVRMPKAYPIYDHDYEKNVNIIRGFLNQLANIQPVGRNGMHRYNNQDHSMMTAMLAARNINGADFDCWAVNTDAEYHESGKAGERKMTPMGS